MAIDYKKEWENLQHIYGKYTIQDNRGIPSIPSTLDELMNFQIQHTIIAREKLMEEYIKENLATDICGGDKHFHHIKITNNRTKGIRSPIGTMYIHKKDFDAWCKKKMNVVEGIKESIKIAKTLV